MSGICTCHPACPGERASRRSLHARCALTDTPRDFRRRIRGSIASGRNLTKLNFWRQIRGRIAGRRNLTNLNFWRRYARGKHPYPSRTRWLSPGRPMVLYWRRYGRAGGCQDQRGLSSAGRAPALQAGGREFESLSLQCGVKLQACTLKTEY